LPVMSQTFAMIYDRNCIDVFSIEFANIGLLPELPIAPAKNIL